MTAVLREDVAAAALEVFLAKGYDRATMREIADRAGLGISSLYGHVATKEALFVGVARPVLEVGTAWMEDVAAAPLVPEEKLRRACVRAAELYDRHPEIAVYLSNGSGEIARALPELTRRAKDAWTRIVGECLGGGVDPTECQGRDVEPDEVRVLAYGILGMFSWMHRWYHPGGGMTATRIGERYAAMLLGGLRPER